MGTRERCEADGNLLPSSGRQLKCGVEAHRTLFFVVDEQSRREIVLIDVILDTKRLLEDRFQKVFWGLLCKKEKEDFVELEEGILLARVGNGDGIEVGVDRVVS